MYMETVCNNLLIRNLGNLKPEELENLNNISRQEKRARKQLTPSTTNNGQNNKLN